MSAATGTIVYISQSAWGGWKAAEVTSDCSRHIAGRGEYATLGEAAWALRRFADRLRFSATAEELAAAQSYINQERKETA